MFRLLSSSRGSGQGAQARPVLILNWLAQRGDEVIYFMLFFSFLPGRCVPSANSKMSELQDIPLELCAAGRQRGAKMGSTLYAEQN